MPAHERTPLTGGSRSFGTSASFLPTLWLLGAANLGYLGDGYDLFSIDLVVAIIQKEYPGQMEAEQKSLAVSSCLAGVIIGQVIFGALANVLGRRQCGIIIAVLQLGGTISSALCNTRMQVSLAHQLAACRFLLGLGIGGEYPLAVTLAVESYSSPSFQGKVSLTPRQLLALTSAAFKVGSLLAATTAFFILSSGIQLDLLWRFALLLGAVPAGFSLILRLKMEEVQVLRDRQTHERSALTAEEGAPCKGGEQSGEVVVAGRQRAEEGGYGTLMKFSAEGLLIGAMVCNFCHNFVVYGQGSYKSIIAEAIFGEARGRRGTLNQDAIFGLWLSLSPLASLMALYPWVDRTTTRGIAIAAYLACAACNFAVACVGFARPMEECVHTMVMLFILASSTWGPLSVASDAVIPVNVPATERALYQGLAMSVGKFGAVCSTILFPVLEAGVGLLAVSLLCAVVAIVGCTSAALSFPYRDADPRQLDAKEY